MNRPSEPQYLLARDARLLRETKQALAETGVQLLDIEVAQITAALDVRSYAPEFEAAAELGARFVGASIWTSDLVVAIDALAALCDLAKPLGLTIALEFMPFSELPTLRQTLDAVRGCARSNVGILIDTLHFHLARTGLRDLETVPASLISYAHVCDGPWRIPPTRRELSDIARQERLFLGEGGIDVARILNGLPPDLTYSLEIANPVRAQTLGAEAYARQALKTAKRYIDAHVLDS